MITPINPTDLRPGMHISFRVLTTEYHEDGDKWIETVYRGIVTLISFIVGDDAPNTHVLLAGSTEWFIVNTDSGLECWI